MESPGFTAFSLPSGGRWRAPRLTGAEASRLPPPANPHELVNHALPGRVWSLPLPLCDHAPYYLEVPSRLRVTGVKNESLLELGLRLRQFILLGECKPQAGTKVGGPGEVNKGLLQAVLGLGPFL